MTFKEFLKKHTNLIMIYFCVIFFAYFANHFEIEGRFDNYIASDAYIASSYNIESQFWPFVDFFKTEYCGTYYTDCFQGIFVSFNFPELLFYSITFVVILFLYWNNKVRK